MKPELHCPLCRRHLTVPAENQIETCACGQRVANRAGVLCFVDIDSFYEGKFAYTKNRRGGLLKKALIVLSINESENRTWLEALPKIAKERGGRLTILNLGAGGGESLLNRFGDVTSLDLSLDSLMNARQVSDLCVQADATKLPFKDGQFDVVFSAHCLGHIPLDQKQAVIKEMFRVTKPGGYSLHSIETDADNFIFKKAKRFPELYQRNFVDMYGHFGLELPSRNFERFRQAGFSPVFERPDYCVGVIRPSNSYKVFFGERAYRAKSPLFGFLFWSSRLMSAKGVLQYAWDCVLRPLSTLNRLFGPESTDSIKVLYAKGSG
ncbi:MAG TPA: class I SAM-dependent methyltransferase [Bdellovibrionales bacterium]|nr:class I SAM-dependent methyltransferase [Bdellovibrionales bacterium]